MADKILEKLEALKTTWDWQKKNGQFIPYPATWLNAEGWEDEVELEDSTIDEAIRLLDAKDNSIEGEVIYD